MVAVAWALLAGGCAAFTAPDTASPSRIWDVHGEAFIAEPVLLARLASVRFRLLGEVHDNPLHHRLRARLLAAMAARGAHPAVVFEQFDLGQDDALGRAQREQTTADRLAEAGALDRRAWQWPLHRPIIEVALAARLPIYAGNATRAMLEDVTRKSDLSTLPRAWQALLANSHWTARQAALLREDIVEGHCGKLPDAMVPHLVLAQRVRDAAMAEALLHDANDDGAILIAGNGHARRDLGVPVYLGDAARNTVSVGLIEVEPAPLQTIDGARTAAMKVSGFDYVWLTPEAPRDDPCAALAISPRPEGVTTSLGGITSPVPPARRR